MFIEPTTLAATATALLEAIAPYDCDAEALFERAGLRKDAILLSGARFPARAAMRLWGEVRRATNDPCIGLFTGQKIRPSAMHALGLSWLASPSTLEGLHRIVRYSQIVNTALRFELEEKGELIKLVRLPIHDEFVADEAIDSTLSAIVKMCRMISNNEFAPKSVSFRHADNGHIDRYIEIFKSPVYFSAKEDALVFDRATLEQVQPAGNHELASENDKLAEKYLATLRPGLMQDKVREILVTLLPSGDTNQETVAANLNRSVSSLQRQLRAEGASYRSILEDTRQTLAEQLVRDRCYSLSQIAYLLGFSDQANFCRAFKRWTGETPGAFRDVAVGR